jgi:hypothetical protein
VGGANRCSSLLICAHQRSRCSCFTKPLHTYLPKAGSTSHVAFMRCPTNGQCRFKRTREELRHSRSGDSSADRPPRITRSSACLFQGQAGRHPHQCRISPPFSWIQFHSVRLCTSEPCNMTPLCASCHACRTCSFFPTACLFSV